MVSQLSNPISLACKNVSKHFPLIEKKSAWRILAGKKDFPVVCAVTGVDITLEKGQIIGLIGGNGAGKSTLLRLLGGVYEPTQGTIWRSGDVMALYELGQFARRTLTGRAYARHFLKFNGQKPEQIEPLLREIMDFSELGEYFDRPIYTYSSGMCSRLYFATSTSLSADIYLIDEALSVGDEHFQAKCWKRLTEKLNQNASSVLVTHDWTSVLKLCSRAYLLEKGKTKFTGNAESTVTTYLSSIREQLAPGARFSNLPAQVSAKTGQSFQMPISITSESDIKDLELSFSIEKLKSGSDWKILILVSDLKIKPRGGRTTFTLEIPDLPIPRGDYYLNLFLTAPKKNGIVSAQPYDVKTWYWGNPIRLKVEDPDTQAMCVLPKTWAVQ